MKLRRRKHVIALAAFLGVVTTLWVLLRYTSIVPQQVARAFTQNLLRDRGYRLELVAVRGNPFGEMVIAGPQLVAERGQPTVVARAAALRLRASIWGLLRGRVHVQLLGLDSPEVRLGTNGIQADLWRGRAPGPRARVPEIEVQRFELQHGRVWGRLGENNFSLSNVDVALSLRFVRDTWRVDLERFTAEVPSDSFRVDHWTGVFEWRADSLFIESFDLGTPTSQVQLHGWVSPRTRSVRLAGSAEPFRLLEVARRLHLPVSGRVQGPFELVGRDSTGTFQGTWTGRIDDYELRDVDLNLAWSPEGLRIDRATGFFSETSFRAALRYANKAINGRATLSDFDLTSVRGLEKFPHTRLNGEVVFSRPKTGALHLDVALDAGKLGDWELRGGRGRLFVRQDGVVIEAGQVETAAAVVVVQGQLLEDRLQLDIDLQADDVSHLLEPLDIVALRGAASLRGRLSGPVDSMACEAEGTLRDGRVGDVQSAAIQFSVSGTNVASQAQWEAALLAAGIDIAGTHFDHAAARIAVADGVVEVRRAEASRGDTRVVAAGRVRRVAQDWSGRPLQAMRIDLETALVTLGSQELRVEEPATLWWRPRTVRVDSLRIASRGGEMRVDGEFDLASRGLDVRGEVAGFDLGFLEPTARWQHRVAGRGTGWVELHGSLERTRVDGALQFRDGVFNNFAFDSLQVELQSDENGIALRSLDLLFAGGALHASGRLAYLPALERWMTAQAGLRSRQELERAAVELDLRVAGLEVDRVWAARRAQPPAVDWGAKLSATLALRGSVAEPRLELRADASELRGRIGEAESVQLTAQYADERLTVPRVEVRAEGAVLEAQGFLPLAWHLLERPRVWRDRPLEAQARLPRSSFAIAERVIPLLESAPEHIPVGEIEGSLDLTGTLDAPRTVGGVRAAGAAFTLEGMQEIYRDVHMQGTFENNTLQITELKARSGEEGELHGSGELSFKGWGVHDYRLSIEATKVPILTIPEMLALVSGRIEMRAARLNGTDPVPEVPRFTGRLNIEDALVTKEFGGEESGGLLEGTDMPEWVADITLEAPGNVWIKNSSADIELEGAVELVRETEGLDVQGRVSVKRGQYTVGLERFEVTRGELDFSKHPGFQPELDFEGRSNRTGEPIYVYVTGQAPDSLRLRFASGVGRPSSSGEVEDLFKSATTGNQFNQLETYAVVLERIAQDLEFIESFHIESARSRNTAVVPFNVSAGKAVSDRIFVVYTQGFNQSDINQRVAVEVAIVRGWLLESSYERRNIPDNQPGRDQNAFDIDLKFRHEY